MSTAATSAAPIDAATIILVRPAGHAFDVLFVQRQRSMAFMGGAHVFPGGKLDPVDCDPDAAAAVPEAVRSQAQTRLEPTPGRPLAPAVALGLHVAAVRELFEEAGVLLAEPREPRVGVRQGELAALRSRLARREQSLARGLAELGLRPAIEGLHYWAHWVTPSLEPRRFDARFFLAELPPGQHAEHDAQESAALAWLTPAAALAAHARGEILLPPPTLRNVEDLAAFDSLAALATAARSRRIAAVMPKIHPVDNLAAVLLPWDPLYETASGDALAVPVPHPLASGPSRIVLRDGRWQSERAGS